MARARLIHSEACEWQVDKHDHLAAVVVCRIRTRRGGLVMLRARTTHSTRRRSRIETPVRPERTEIRIEANAGAAPAIPSATYRLQFNRNFRFADATQI